MTKRESVDQKLSEDESPRINLQELQKKLSLMAYRLQYIQGLFNVVEHQCLEPDLLLQVCEKMLAGFEIPEGKKVDDADLPIYNALYHLYRFKEVYDDEFPGFIDFYWERQIEFYKKIVNEQVPPKTRCSSPADYDLLHKLVKHFKSIDKSYLCHEVEETARIFHNLFVSKSPISDELCYKVFIIGTWTGRGAASRNVEQNIQVLASMYWEYCHLDQPKIRKDKPTGTMDFPLVSSSSSSSSSLSASATSFTGLTGKQLPGFKEETNDLALALFGPLPEQLEIPQSSLPTKIMSVPPASSLLSDEKLLENKSPGINLEKLQERLLRITDHLYEIQERFSMVENWGFRSDQLIQICERMLALGRDAHLSELPTSVSKVLKERASAYSKAAGVLVEEALIRLHTLKHVYDDDFPGMMNFYWRRQINFYKKIASEPSLEPPVDRELLKRLTEHFRPFKNSLCHGVKETAYIIHNFFVSTSLTSNNLCDELYYEIIIGIWKFRFKDTIPLFAGSLLPSIKQNIGDLVSMYGKYRHLNQSKIQQDDSKEAMNSLPVSSSLFSSLSLLTFFASLTRVLLPSMKQSLVVLVSMLSRLSLSQFGTWQDNSTGAMDSSSEVTIKEGNSVETMDLPPVNFPSTASTAMNSSSASRELSVSGCSSFSSSSSASSASFERSQLPNLEEDKRALLSAIRASRYLGQPTIKEGSLVEKIDLPPVNFSQRAMNFSSASREAPVSGSSSSSASSISVNPGSFYKWKKKAPKPAGNEIRPGL